MLVNNEGVCHHVFHPEHRFGLRSCRAGEPPAQVSIVTHAGHGGSQIFNVARLNDEPGNAISYDLEAPRHPRRNDGALRRGGLQQCFGNPSR